MAKFTTMYEQMFAERQYIYTIIYTAVAKNNKTHSYIIKKDENMKGNAHTGQ
jgi:hypothetical protein